MSPQITLLCNECNFIFRVEDPGYVECHKCGNTLSDTEHRVPSQPEVGFHVTSDKAAELRQEEVAHDSPL